MVRIIILALLLMSCTAQHVKLGKEVEPPYGWKYTYCPAHPDKCK